MASCESGRLAIGESWIRSRPSSHVSLGFKRLIGELKVVSEGVWDDRIDTRFENPYFI